MKLATISRTSFHCNCGLYLRELAPADGDVVEVAPRECMRLVCERGGLTRQLRLLASPHSSIRQIKLYNINFSSGSEIAAMAYRRVWASSIIAKPHARCCRWLAK